MLKDADKKKFALQIIDTELFKVRSHGNKNDRTHVRNVSPIPGSSWNLYSADI